MQLAWATFSPCKMYRYDLYRKLSGDGRGTLIAVMLNPSTADAEKDDPTIRRLMGFGRAWNCYALHVLNLFAIRATDPRVMLAADDPVGPENDAKLAEALASTDPLDVVLAAWGQHGAHRARAFHVMHHIAPNANWQCLGMTHGGQPKHPLYIPKNTMHRPMPR